MRVGGGGAFGTTHPVRRPPFPAELFVMKSYYNNTIGLVLELFIPS